MVSTTVVEGRWIATLTGMNCPLRASRPIFVPFAIDYSIGSEAEEAAAPVQHRVAPRLKGRDANQSAAEHIMILVLAFACGAQDGLAAAHQALSVVR